MGRYFFLTFCLALLLIFPLSLGAQHTDDWALSAFGSAEAFWPGDQYEETEGRGLYIRSNPMGVRVYIDGIEMGRTPVHLDSLRPGRYFVRLEREGYQERRFRVTVRAGSVVNITVEMKEALGRVLLKISDAPDVSQSISSQGIPHNLQISVDGVLYNSTALELPVGFRNILVRAFGREDILTTLYIEEGSYRELDLNLIPALFKLSNASVSRHRFNPANAGSLGTTTFSFEVSAPGRGSFTVLDSDGRTVMTRDLGHFETWSQSVVWNGMNNRGEVLNDGTYTLLLQAVSTPRDDSPPVTESLSLKVELDSTQIIIPLSLASGKSGLLFAPLPQLLPAGSFQIEGSLAAANPYGGGGLFKSLPFAVALRFSPVKRLEVSASLNVIPMFEKESGAGISGGVKWAFHDSGIFGAAAAFNFSWTGKTSFTPFGMSSGFELYVPLKLDLGKFFSLALSPSILWTGDELSLNEKGEAARKGFPWDPVPRVSVSGGVMMRMTYFVAGLSVRSQYKFSGDDAWPPFIIAGGEVKFFPPPSSFVFSFNGGVWSRDATIGGFFGVSIGIIF